MKVKVSKKELYECVERAVIRAINESKKNALNEGWDDDDDDVLSRFLKDPRNNPKYDAKKGRVMQRVKGGGAAQKQAEKDIEAELKSQEADDKKAADAEYKEMHGDD